MSRVAVLGDELQIQGFALAGAVLCPAADAAAARAACRSLPADVAVLVLTAQAARWLGGATAAELPAAVLPVVMPE
ncbi:MAG: V-type ATP synthase subunit F [Streptosporangiaceae bacterium]